MTVLVSKYIWFEFSALYVTYNTIHSGARIKEEVIYQQLRLEWDSKELKTLALHRGITANDDYQESKKSLPVVCDSTIEKIHVHVTTWAEFERIVNTVLNTIFM